MKVLVLVQFVPDLVEELVIDSSGTQLDPDSSRLILSEFDDHAIEQAILIREACGAEVVVAAPDMEGADDALFTAAAKGANRLVKITGDFEAQVNSHALARLFMPIVQQESPDLILTGVQAHVRFDGALGALLAGMMNLPYLGYVSSVKIDGKGLIVKKEYPGGILGEFEVGTPAVLGIQAAEKPPRYVPVSKVRQAMKSSKISEEENSGLDPDGAAPVSLMRLPEATGRAEMLKGNVDDIADKLIQIMQQQGVM